MAKKRAGSKGNAGDGKNISATIRELIAANPTAKGKEIAELASKAVGKKVSPNYVYIVKASKSGGKKKATRTAKARGIGGGKSSDADIAMSVVRGVRFVEAVGGIAQARKIIDLLEAAG
jgi:hypothetical protein